MRSHPRTLGFAVVLLSLAAVGADPVLADIVTLKNGGKIEGLVEARGDRYVVRTTDGMEVEIPMEHVDSVDVKRVEERPEAEKKAEKEAEKPPGEAVDPERKGLVRHRGRWITPEEREAIREKESLDKEAKRIRKLIRKIPSQAPGVADDAMARLQAYSHEEKLPHLLDALDAADKPVRIYAAGELGRSKAEDAVAGLAVMAMEDRYRTARVAAVQALRSIGSESTAEHFMQGLSASNPFHRLHAIEGLRAFPNRRAVRRLIETWHGISGGFGQGYFQDTIVTTYITDYELASGGTGFVVVEIADPIVGVVQTGTVLDVKIEYVEIVARVQTLSYLTGAKRGGKRKDWVTWYNENKDTFELAVDVDGQPTGEGAEEI